MVEKLVKLLQVLRFLLNYKCSLRWVFFHVTDIDECSLEIDDCNESKVCINTEGSFECIASICTKGYTQNKETGQCEGEN